MLHGVRSSTRDCYSSAQKKYIQFCAWYDLSPFPASMNTILLYIAYMNTQGLSASTMSVYLSSIRSAHVMAGYQEPNIRSPQVKLALKAIKDNSAPPLQKKPIVYTMLKQMISVLNNESNAIMWSAMLSLAFFAGLRGAEYAMVSLNSGHMYPCLSHIQFATVDNTKVMYYQVQSAKTNVHGYKVPVGCTGAYVCAYCMMLRYVKHQFSTMADPHMPLFVFQNGQVVSKNHVNLLIKKLVAKLGYNVADYSTHSIRAGAASTAAAMGFNDWEIMRLGGWRSAAYRSYIRSVDSHVAGLSARLVTTPL